MTLQQWRQLEKADWKTAPINSCCDHIGCDAPTVKAYPAMGGGWCSLCAEHGEKHPDAFDAGELIATGEQWA